MGPAPLLAVISHLKLFADLWVLRKLNHKHACEECELLVFLMIRQKRQQVLLEEVPVTEANSNNWIKLTVHLNTPVQVSKTFFAVLMLHEELLAVDLLDLADTLHSKEKIVLHHPRQFLTLFTSLNVLESFFFPFSQFLSNELSVSEVIIVAKYVGVHVIADLIVAMLRLVAQRALMIKVGMVVEQLVLHMIFVQHFAVCFKR